MSDSKLLKFMGITFASTHLPLVALVLYGVNQGFAQLLPAIGLVLISTLIGTALALFQVYLAYRVETVAQPMQPL